MGAIVLDPRDASTLKQIQELTHGIGVDFSVDCSGNTQAHRICVDVTRRRGQFAFIGECSEVFSIYPSNDMIRKGLTIFGSWHYNMNWFPLIIKVIQ